MVNIFIKFKKHNILKMIIAFVLCVSLILTFVLTLKNKVIAINQNCNEDYIKWAEFDVSYSALEDAMKLDISSHNDNIKLDWIEILSILGAKYSGDFSKYKNKDLQEIAQKLKSGENIDEITKKLKQYKYYNEFYSTVLKEFLGEYKKEKYISENNNEKTWESGYGLKAFSPIAKTFPYQDYDDFGASRTYGYTRKHLGHDMICATGTPVIAIESGKVEVMGWNQYGGWRIGIRSFDNKRYYYYAHLRQNRPYHCDLYEGKTVTAGDVIGYVGRTGYSSNENSNNIETSHLHIGLQLIFDESQKDCNNEIWIDIYPLIQLLQKNKCDVYRNTQTKEYYRNFNFEDISNEIFMHSSY